MNEQTILRGVSEVLRQGEILVLALDDAAYTTRIPCASNASVGGHYRHSLDHFRSLLVSLDADEVNYDRRERDPRIETERAFAASETRRIFRGIESIPTEWLKRPLLARGKVSYSDDDAPAMPSTVGRELMYAVTHAIHHYALIGIMCRMLEVSLPAGFGVAPSTLKHQADEAKQQPASAH